MISVNFYEIVTFIKLFRNMHMLFTKNVTLLILQ